jgi:hypothetical protein
MKLAQAAYFALDTESLDDPEILRTRKATNQLSQPSPSVILGENIDSSEPGIFPTKLSIKKCKDTQGEIWAKIAVVKA